MATIDANKRLVRSYFEAIGGADLERIASMMAPELRLRCAGGTGAEP